MVNIVKSLMLIVAVSVLSGAANAVVDVRVDRPTIAFGDTVQIVFSSEQLGEPDWSPLNTDFELLSTAQNSSISLIGNRMEQTVSWTVDLSPRRVGELTVPPIVFGTESSEQRTITVTPANDVPVADREVFLEVEAKPATPYVQAQTRLTIRLFRSVRISDASLSEPVISSGDAVIERLGEDINYETTRGGVRFAVTERRYAIFPQQSGLIVVDPIVFAARVGGRTSIFDRSGGRIVRARSETMEIEVRPIPSQFSGQIWLPAEHLVLSEEWPRDDDQWRVGEPLTRSLILRARGLTASQLPEIAMPLPEGFKQYPDQPQLNTGTTEITQIASRRESIALIPSQAGAFTFPAIEIPWWNTETDSLEYARLPERTVRVLPALNAAPETTPVQSQPASEQEPVTVATDETPAAAPVVSAANSVWKWISLALGLLWLLTLAAWWWSRRRGAAIAQPKVVQLPKPAVAIAALQQACRDNDPAAAQDALLQWATSRWPGNAARSLGELAARIDGPMQSELHRLSRARFSKTDTQWDGAALWQAFQSHKGQRATGIRSTQPELEPLYRSR